MQNIKTSLQSRAWEIVEGTRSRDLAGRVFGYSIAALISLNILSIILDSIQSIHDKYADLFDRFEVFSIIVFTLEYCIRLCSCTTDKRYSKPIKGRLKFILTPMSVIDILAILPFYICFMNVDLRFIRIVRLTRIIRLIKMGRYLKTISLFRRVFLEKKEEIFISICFMLGLLIVTSCLIYYLEYPIQPQVFSSIPITIGWTISALSMIGSNDAFPITTAGKTLAYLVALLGLGLFAWPAGIISAGFVDQVTKDQNKTKCPHCGEEIDV